MYRTLPVKAMQNIAHVLYVWMYALWYKLLYKLLYSFLYSFSYKECANFCVRSGQEM
jgi:hypothetical protein